MTAWVGWSALVLSFAVMVIALALVLFSKRNLPTVILAVFLFVWGILGAMIAWAQQADPGAWTQHVDPVVFGASILVYALYSVALISFAVVYPNLSLTRGKLAVIGAALLVFLAFIIAASILLWTPDHLEVLWSYAILFGDVTLLVGVGFLGARWVRARTSAYRMQVLWGLLVFIFWSLHHAFLAIVVIPLQFGGSLLSLGQVSWVWIATSWVSVLAGSAAMILVLLSLVRYVKGKFDASDRALVLLTPFMLAATTLQVYLFDLHILLDYLAAAFVIYGVLRFNVVDLDLKMKWGVKQSTVVAAFVAAFFVVSETAKVFFEGALNSTILGILAAGALVFAISPLQRMGDGISNRMLPDATGGKDYFTYRRFQIYRVAMEGALQDGVVRPAEANALRNLRLELGLSDEDHQRMELELKSSLARRGAEEEKAT